MIYSTFAYLHKVDWASNCLGFSIIYLNATSAHVIYLQISCHIDYSHATVNLGLWRHAILIVDEITLVYSLSLLRCCHVCFHL